VKTGENSVTFSLELADMDLYLPGNRRITVTYTVTDTAALQLHYSVTTDKKTFLNFTNHAYFNLNGQGGAKIYDTKLRLFCSRYTPVVKGAIPTGEIAEVKGTPLDFTGEKTIGRDIDADFEQLKLVGGYDHNFVIDGWTPESGAACRMNKTASVYDPESGRRMEVFTSLPGVQFYAGNFIAGMMKGGRPAMPRDGFALETQYYPDSIHHADFPQAVFSPDRPYESVTEYKFSWQ
jgi:aldose 1-epimerase